MKNSQIEDNIVEFDGMNMDVDIKINPDFYIHIALVNAQKTFLKPDIKEGFSQYIMYVEHIEVLCKSAHMLPEKYDELIKKAWLEIQEEEREGQNPDPIVQKVKLANKKLGLMTGEVFQRKAITAPLTYDHSKEEGKK